MGAESVKKKMQNVAYIVRNAKNTEDVLNCDEIDIESDFQFICLNSASNYNIVLQVIAKLAQGENANVVVDNIKLISFSMWKDLFGQNEQINKIFKENFETIYDNTTIISCTELESFMKDVELEQIIYAHLDGIVKKLSTQDRASFITLLNEKKDGYKIVKEHLPVFFKKGIYDISTTYSRILKELDKTKEVTKIDILRACSDSFQGMLKRETAVDNETNKLLNWIYDAFEETKMDETERAEIKEKIDTAIISNFDNILDKSNYSKETIKALKQFDCTREAFAKNNNHYIDKSLPLVGKHEGEDVLSNKTEDTKVSQIKQNKDVQNNNKAQDNSSKEDKEKNSKEMATKSIPETVEQKVLKWLKRNLN